MPPRTFERRPHVKPIMDEVVAHGRIRKVAQRDEWCHMPGQATTRQRQTPVILDFENRQGDVVVVPENKDTYCTTVDAVMKALKTNETATQFLQQFGKLLDHLAAWINQHRDVIGRACLTVRDAELLFLIIQRDVRYNAEFEDGLADLDINVAQNPSFSLIRMSVLALPVVDDISAASFLVPGNILEYRL